MALVSLTSITNGTLADATTIMANYNALATQLNGNLDASNIKNAVITAPKLHPTISPLALFNDNVSRRIYHGITNITWPGNGAYAQLSIPHGLGVAPSRVFVTGNPGVIAGGPHSIIWTGYADAGNLLISAFSPDGNPQAGLVTYAWYLFWP